MKNNRPIWILSAAFFCLAFVGYLYFRDTSDKVGISEKKRPTFQEAIALLDNYVDSDADPQSRGIASAEGAKLTGLDKDFFDLYSSSSTDVVNYLVNRSLNPNVQDPEKMLGHYLEQMSRIYYRTDIKVQQFDKILVAELRKSPENRIDSMMNHSVYKNDLVPLWIMKEKIRKQIIFVILKLLYMEHAVTTEVTPDKMQAAKNMISFTRQIWTHIGQDNAPNPEHLRNNRVIRFVLQDLFRDTSYTIVANMDEYYRKWEAYPPPNISEFLKITQDIIVDSPEELKTLEASIRADLSLQVENETDSIKEEAGRPTSWIALVRQQLGSQLVESYDVMKAQSRTPQADAKFCPDASSARGNIVGNEFHKGVWAVTLDDGPHSTHSATIFNAFKNQNTKGSFFWLSKLTSAASNQSVIGQIKAAGYTMASHSLSHANLPTLGQSALDKEIIESTRTHTQYFGYKPKFFRCPYGACGPSGGNIRKMIADQGFVHVFWNIDTLDWKDKNADILLPRIQQQIEVINSKNRGGVILFHDIHQSSAETVRRLIPWMVSQGYQVKSLDEIVTDMNAGGACPDGWKPYNNN
jgi:peptidoglycan/xylan/chitin deacetylase (PgdA/CDA1 family)